MITVDIPENLPAPKWGFMGEDIYKRTYSRIMQDGSKESWRDTVKRVVEGNCSFVDESHIEKNEPEKLFDLLYNFKILPGGRHLWVTGIEGSQYVANCWTAGHDPDSFSEHFTFLFARLMEGGGVGANYSDKFFKCYKPFSSRVRVSVVCDPNHKDYEELREHLDSEVSYVWQGCHQIADSREGWVDALRILLEAVYSEEDEAHVVFDVSGIRPRGARLRTFGGTASGPLALTIMLYEVADLLNAVYESGEKPGWRLAMDIDHLIAKTVIAGNVRRSARMSMKHWKDDDILDFIAMKQDGMGHWTTNISVILDTAFWRSLRRKSKHAQKVLRAVSEGMLANGEPGIFNETKAQEGELFDVYCCNPCFVGDTLLVTRSGLRSIESLVGEDFNVWDGEKWVKSTAVKSGHKEVVRLTLSNGQTIRLTPDHKLMTLEGDTVEARDSLGVSLRPMVPERGELLTHPFYVKLGFMQGDGSYHKASGRWKYVNIGKSDEDIFDLFKDDVGESSPSKPHAFPLSKEYAKEINEYLIPVPLPERHIHSSILTASPSTVASFLRGLYSANGCVVDGRVVLKSSCRQLIDDVQKMLTLFGIRSYVTTNKAHEVEFSNGTYLCKESYDLNVTSEELRIFQEHIGFVHRYKQEALDACVERETKRRIPVQVVSVDPDGEDDVYDFSMEETHWASVEGFCFHNCGEITLPQWGSCNLGSVNLREFIGDTAGMQEAFRLMARFLVRATFADYPDPKAKEVVSRDRRIGVGITGFADWQVLEAHTYSHFPNCEGQKSKLKAMGKVVREAARRYAFELRIPEPVKCTMVAPTGTTSKLCGVSEGIQPILFKYFKRRVCFSLTDDDQRQLVEDLEKKGYEVEDSAYNPNTKVVSYYCRASIFEQEDLDESFVEAASDITLEESLAVQKTIQSVFADNSVSFTINVDPESITVKELERALVAFGPDLKGTTVMPVVSNREQMPYEEITKEEYDAAQYKHTSMTEVECKNGICHLVTKTEDDPE